MAELAFGAVQSLLGLIRDEVQQLARVGNDVYFIKEEMESMNTFLLHLNKTAPLRGEHEEPVRTWMKQVRDLAYDCSNCIDLYVLRGGAPAPRAVDDPSVLVRYLQKVPWSLRALFTQYQAAARFRELKVRARDVAERRVRYGVELPKTDDKKKEASPSFIQDEGDVVSDDDLIREVVLSCPDEPNILDKYTQDLVKWLISVTKETKKAAAVHSPLDNVITIAAPDKEDGDEVAQAAFKHAAVAGLFKKKVWLTVDSNSKSISFHPEDDASPELRLRLEESKFLIVGGCLPRRPGLQQVEKAATTRKEWGIVEEIRERLLRRGLQGDARSLMVIECNDMRMWKLMEEALTEFGCAAGSAVIVTTKDSQLAKQLILGGKQKAIIYSLVHFFVELIRDRNYDRNLEYYLNIALRPVLLHIQERCDNPPFCLRMFVHYLCAHPATTEEEEVAKLRSMLVHPYTKGFRADPRKIKEANTKRLLKFCYDDLPRTYKTCLLYLAIFPEGENMRRSRLVGRWIIEGLITGRDLPDAVREAERCFDALLNRWLVSPGDIGVTGNVKSCMVKHELVQELITDVAREERFLDPRLSRHLAKHFSIHSELHLLRSDNIMEFMRSLRKKSRSNISHTPSQLNLLKVLDLQGLKELPNKYLNNICNNLPLLKYLSLRNTDITRLPKKKINKLLQLEVLDIRQTKVRPSDTKDIMLPKLKRLLSGLADQIASTEVEEPFSSVQIPSKIKNMANIEVLSHVEASEDATELEDIGRQLWQMRKFGVVIRGDKESHLKNLFKAITDLNECALQSLSIRIKSAASNTLVPADALIIRTSRLESLTISGITSGPLLPLFFKDGNEPIKIAKVTLHSTKLELNHLEILGKLPNLRCLRLRGVSFAEGKLITFKVDVFGNLKYLLVEDSDIIDISFDEEAAPELQKIVWYFTNMESLRGIDKLDSLKELELNGDNIPDKVKQDIAQHPKGLVFKHNVRPRDQGLGAGMAGAAAP